jgi:hypothetical protein
MNRVKINSHWQWAEALAVMETLRQREVYGVKVAKSFIEFTDNSVREAFAVEVNHRIAALKGANERGRLNALNSLRRHLGGALK